MSEDPLLPPGAAARHDTQDARADRCLTLLACFYKSCACAQAGICQSGILWRLRKPVVRRGEQVQELCEVGLERDAVVGEREVVLVVTKGHLV